jgi:hypothetical protein
MVGLVRRLGLPVAAVVAAMTAAGADAQTLPPLPTTSNEPAGSTSIAGVAAVADTVPGLQITSGGRVQFSQSIVGVNVVDQFIPPVIKIPGQPAFVDTNFVREALVQQSFQSNAGVIAFNQDVGTVNNQLNALVITVRDPGTQSDQPVNLDSLSITGRVTFDGNSIVSTGGTRQDKIENSFGGTTGVVAVNQSAGVANQQSNALVIGIGLQLDPEQFVQLGNDTLSNVTNNNTTADQSGGADSSKTKRTDSVTDSFAGFSGIAQVAQSSGNGNVVGNHATVAVPSFAVGLGVLR